MRILVAVLFVLLSASAGRADPEGLPTVTIRLDPAVTYQTVEGWGATLSTLGLPFDEWLKDRSLESYSALRDPLPETVRLALLDAAVRDLGLNRFRLEIGPQVVLGAQPGKPKTYLFAWQDAWMEKWVLPLKQRVEARGEKLVVYVSYDLRSSATPEWLWQPDEYAAMAVAFLTHLKQKYHFEPDYWTTINEPGNERPGDPKLVAQLIATTGRRLKEAGFRTRMSGPEVVTPKQLSPYLAAMKDTPGALEALGQITYHLYWNPTNVPARHEAAAWAKRLGITTAQTEWMEPRGLEAAEHLYLDLTEANVSAWEQYSLCFTENEYNAQGSGDYFVLKPDCSGFRLNTNGWYLRQYMHFLRPGAMRVRIASPDPEVKPVAFTNRTGQTIVVTINSCTQPRPVSFENLPAGRYTVSYTAADALGKALPDLVVAPDAPARMALPAKSVVTLARVGR